RRSTAPSGSVPSTATPTSTACSTTPPRPGALPKRTCSRGAGAAIHAIMEFALIDRIRRRAATRGDVVLGIGDDAALLQPPPGMLLAVATDTLNIDVHFPADTAPADIGWKALAVNLSDLAAMAARPAWATLSLSLPHAGEQALGRFV